MYTIEQPGADHDKSGKGNKGSKRSIVLVAAVIALALVAAAAAWVVIDQSGDDSATATTPTTTTPVVRVGPVVVSLKTLSALAANVGHTVYWAGPIAGTNSEFTKTTIARVFVRYLPKGVRAGDPGTKYLIVATYPFADAYNALKKAAKGSEVTIPGGGIAVVSKTNPTSVNFAFPDTPYQGEVYDPSPAKALSVATSGDIQPIP